MAKMPPLPMAPEPYVQPPFVNSMQYDNEPGEDTSTAPEDDRGQFGPERKVMRNSGGEVQVPPNAPLPHDPNAGSDDSQTGHNASVHQYGLL